MKTKKQILVRITTVPLSLEKLISGQMYYMGDSGFEVKMISSDFEMKKELELKENAEFIPVNMTRTISPFADLKSLYQLVRILQKVRPNIVHTHTPKAGLLGMLAARLVGVPIRLHTVAGLPLMETRGLKRIILEFVEKVTYWCATKIYPNSKNLKEFLLKEGFISKDKLKVIGNGSSNGINSEEFRLTDEVKMQADLLAKKYLIENSDFTFLFIGRLVKDKGVEELVESFVKMSAKHSNLKLLLVGPEEGELDPLSSKCRSEILSNSSIISVGYQFDVKPYLALGDAFVFPSYREGFPNAPMQAGCFNLPSIVTNINGCNEIIVEGENGVIIPVKNVDFLYDAMDRLYVDRELYKRMSANARRMIIDRYEQSKVWALILDEYNMHLGNNGLL